MWYTFSQSKSKDNKSFYDLRKLPAEELAAALAMGQFLESKSSSRYSRLIEAIVVYLADFYGEENIHDIMNNLQNYKKESLYIKAIIEESGIYFEAEKNNKNKSNVAEDIMEYVNKRYPAKLKMTPAVYTFRNNLVIYEQIKEMIENEMQSESFDNVKDFIKKLDEFANKKRNINGKSYTLYEISKALGIAENQLGELADDSPIIREIYKNSMGLQPSNSILDQLRQKFKLMPNQIAKLKLTPAMIAKLGTATSLAELVAMPSSGNINLMRAPWVDTGETKEAWFKNHKAEHINEYLVPVLEEFLKDEANRIKLDSSITPSKKLIEFGKLYNKYFSIFGSSKWDDITKVFMQNIPESKIHPKNTGKQVDLYSAFKDSPIIKK